MRHFRQLIADLYQDESGFVEAVNYLLILTLLAIGAIAGITAVRDSITTELGDLSLALECLDQTYTVNATIGTVVKQFGFQDFQTDVPAACTNIEFNQPPQNEGSGGGGGGGGGPLAATPE